MLQVQGHTQHLNTQVIMPHERPEWGERPAYQHKAHSNIQDKRMGLHSLAVGCPQTAQMPLDGCLEMTPRHSCQLCCVARSCRYHCQPHPQTPVGIRQQGGVQCGRVTQVCIVRACENGAVPAHQAHEAQRRVYSKGRLSRIVCMLVDLLRPLDIRHMKRLNRPC